MKELLYFPSADLIIKVEYSKDVNSLRYWTNREVTLKERQQVEQYLLSDFAAKVGYYDRHPSLFICMGEESGLNKELAIIHLSDALKDVSEKEQQAERSVKSTIRKSMANYYFERIGDEILALRERVLIGCEQDHIQDAQGRMAELLSAYNHYSRQCLSLDDVLPADLQEYFPRERAADRQNRIRP